MTVINDAQTRCHELEERTKLLESELSTRHSEIAERDLQIEEGMKERVALLEEKARLEIQACQAQMQAESFS